LRDPTYGTWRARRNSEEGFPGPPEKEGDNKMLYWALIFLVIALVAAFLGFGVIANAFAGVAKILFFLFIVVFLVSLIMGLARRA
jgi:uncharacterized membrane protein YtjA (UPF0391 family)